MLQKFSKYVCMLASLAYLATGCGQGSLMKEAASGSENRKSAGSLGSGEDKQADAPQSIAGAYLTCDEYENVLSPQGKVVSTRCKVLDNQGKRVPMSTFPKRDWGVSDQFGKAIAKESIQMTEKKDDGTADVEVQVTLSDVTINPVVDFWFDKTDPSTLIRATIPLKGTSKQEILRVLSQIGGLWDISQGCSDEALALTKLGVIEVKVTGVDTSNGQQIPLVEASVPANGSGLKDAKGNKVAAGTSMFTGRVYYNAFPPYIELTVKANNIVKEPDPANNPKLRVINQSKLEMVMKEKVLLSLGGTRTTQWELVKVSAALTR